MIEGKISSQKETTLEQAAQGGRCSHHQWIYFKDVWIQHLGTQFSDGLSSAG